MKQRKDNISFEAPGDLSDALRRMAAQSERSLSAMIRHLLKEAIEKQSYQQDERHPQAA